MQSRIKDLVVEYLSTDPEAQLFFYSYLIHCHSVDDIIDGDRSDSDFIIKAFSFTITLCSAPFYRKYQHILEPIMFATANSYADSVKFERCKNDKWKQQYADVLRQAGNDVLLACIEIVSGYDAKREASAKLRELSYKQHHNEKGEII